MRPHRLTAAGSFPCETFDGTRRLTNCLRADGCYEQVYMRRAREGDEPRYRIEGEWWTPVEGLAKIVMQKGWEP